MTEKEINTVFKQGAELQKVKANLNRAVDLLNQANTDREIYRPDMEAPDRLLEYDTLSDEITDFLNALPKK